MLRQAYRAPSIKGWRSLLTRSLTVIASTGLACAIGAAAVRGQSPDPAPNFERCKVITNDQLRLNCLRNLLAKPVLGGGTSSSPEGWRLVRTPNPAKGPDAMSIMRTADALRSDPDLAGLMIRCEDNRELEVSLALIRPIPPRSKRDVVVSWGTTQSRFQAEASSAGTALNLPAETTAMARAAWQGQKELAVTIKDPEADIHGVIALDGLSSAMVTLSANCPK